MTLTKYWADGKYSDFLTLNAFVVHLVIAWNIVLWFNAYVLVWSGTLANDPVKDTPIEELIAPAFNTTVPVFG